MIIFEEEKLKKEIIKIALFSAKTFSYYKSKNPDAGNFYVGENEIEGQCSDYALVFVNKWNEKHPENQAEIVTINQPWYIESGSHKVIKEIPDFDLPAWKRTSSQWIGRQKIDGIECSILFHPHIGFYQLMLSKTYEVKQHFGFEMSNKGPHVWAKIGDIAIDPCWADTDNTPFIGEDIIN
jgi:hypothetical protein